jgi:hypothetical protein
MKNGSIKDPTELRKRMYNINYFQIKMLQNLR